jgi:hypothetical protein
MPELLAMLIEEGIDVEQYVKLKSALLVSLNSAHC